MNTVDYENFTIKYCEKPPVFRYHKYPYSSVKKDKVDAA